MGSVAIVTDGEGWGKKLISGRNGKMVVLGSFLVSKHLPTPYSIVET